MVASLETVAVTFCVVPPFMDPFVGDTLTEIGFSVMVAVVLKLELLTLVAVRVTVVRELTGVEGAL